MCYIVDVVYRLCGCKLDRIEYCSNAAPGEVRTVSRATEKEYLNLLCPTCVKISEIRKEYEEGWIGPQQMEAEIADLERGMVKAQP
jgi:hypothetical protein